LRPRAIGGQPARSRACEFWRSGEKQEKREEKSKEKPERFTEDVPLGGKSERGVVRKGESPRFLERVELGD
jgi:hypothetical protein